MQRMRRFQEMGYVTRTALALMAAAVIMTGCAAMQTTTEGRRLYRDQVIQIKPGVTTRDAAIEMFGEPTSMEADEEQERLTYVFKEKRLKSYFGGRVEDEAGAGTTTTTLELIIRDGIVWSYNFKSSEE